MALVSMFDSDNLSGIPHGPYAVAAYVDGASNFDQIPSYFPSVPAYRRKSIATDWLHDADILDIEPGCALPGQAPGWFTRQKARGLEMPELYSTISDAPTVIEVMASHGIPRAAYWYWTAHVGVGPHICSPHTCGYQGASTPTADMTQWLFAVGYDESLCNDYVFAAPTPPPPADPYHYLWFPAPNGPGVKGFTGGPFRIGRLELNERQVVQQYDRLRAHPHVNAARLHVLQAHLRLLAGRVWEIAHAQRQNGVVPWNDGRRLGWRYGQLSGRADGRRFTK